jgi:hypothetical protein
LAKIPHKPFLIELVILSLFRLYLDGKCIPAGLVPLINLLKIIPITTAENERGFSFQQLL